MYRGTCTSVEEKKEEEEERTFKRERIVFKGIV